MKFISIIALMSICGLSISQADTSDLILLNIKAPYNYSNDSNWIENYKDIIDQNELEFISSLDSALTCTTNPEFIHSIIHTLLSIRHDSGYQVIFKHLKSKGYHRTSSPLGGIKYPVIEAILNDDKSQFPFITEFLLKSHYFEQEIDPNDIFFYRTLMLSGIPVCDVWIVPFKPSEIFKSNLKAILDTHIIFNY